MGIPIFILGESGTGKSASLRNFKSDEIALINVSGKPLPFRSKIKPYCTDDYSKIVTAIKKTERKIIVIDDSQYLIVNEFMRTSKQTGYQKYNDMANNFWSLVQTVIKDLSHDKTVYFLHHIETSENGKQKCKTIGKLLDEKVTIEGYFTVVLKTAVEDGKYKFITKNSGNDTVKSPIGLFEENEIDNDLKVVDTAIREYYELK